MIDTCCMLPNCCPWNLTAICSPTSTNDSTYLLFSPTALPMEHPQIFVFCQSDSKILKVAWICTPLSSESERLFIYLRTVCFSFSASGLFISFVHFSIELLALFLLISRRFLYTREKSPLPITWVVIPTTKFVFSKYRFCSWFFSLSLFMAPQNLRSFVGISEWIEWDAGLPFIIFFLGGHPLAPSPFLMSSSSSQGAWAALWPVLASAVLGSGSCGCLGFSLRATSLQPLGCQRSGVYVSLLTRAGLSCWHTPHERGGSLKCGFCQQVCGLGRPLLRHQPEFSLPPWCAQS